MNYRINEPRVAHETLDDERIIIDFETGVNYSSRSEAMLIWQAICEGYSLEIISESIVARSMKDRYFIFGRVK